MQYRIQFVADELMPKDRIWLMCHQDEVITLYLARASHGLPEEAKARQLEQAWAAYRLLAEELAPA